MDSLDPSGVQVLGGFLMLTAVFALREIASGALKEAGKELWCWLRQHRTRDTDDPWA
jgi:hypothetical protein